MKQEFRVCIGCKLKLPLASFYQIHKKNKPGKTFYFSRCKKCKAEQARKYATKSAAQRAAKAKERYNRVKQDPAAWAKLLQKARDYRATENGKKVRSKYGQEYWLAHKEHLNELRRLRKSKKSKND